MWESRTGVPSPAIESKKYFAGLLVCICLTEFHYVCIVPIPSTISYLDI